MQHALGERERKNRSKPQVKISTDPEESQAFLNSSSLLCPGTAFQGGHHEASLPERNKQHIPHGKGNPSEKCNFQSTSVAEEPERYQLGISMASLRFVKQFILAGMYRERVSRAAAQLFWCPFKGTDNIFVSLGVKVSLLIKIP